jgi:Dinucleotide-utilizing enzymes involved in molybdopterin and thiamine biosynthesis family 2
VNFSEKEMMKYSRNIMLTDIGVEGQKLLKNSTVTIIGVGGLGCACSQYLVASGIGNLNLFDPDQVDLSNLQRQILFREEDLNAFKVDAAVKSLLRLNPDVNIKKFRQSFEKIVFLMKIQRAKIL